VWKRAVKYSLSVVVGLAIGIAMSQVALWQMRPPFYHEYHQITDEIYARYLTDGALPAPSALSAPAQKTLSENKGIEYSVDDGLSYMYDKPYPINQPFIGFMTFGLCWGGTPTGGGESQSPKDLIHNARLRAGKLQ